MAQCVEFDSNGFLVQSAASPCVAGVVLAPAEYALLASSPFHMTAAEGAWLSSQIILVWVVAFAVRALIRTLFGSKEADHEPA